MTFRLSRTLLPASPLLVSVLAAPTAHAVSFSGQPVAKSEWTKTAVPSYIDMFIGLPDTMPEKPPILVNIHSCGNNAGGQWSYDGFAPLRAAMDSVGFIMIVPQQSRNCWNVGAPESLTHDGGGDTGAIVQMVQYALEKYNGDATRVYVMGGSGGGMCTQALLAVYPEIFKAGHERAGVAAGCWAEQYDDGMQWSGPCANGSVDKTPQEWGDYVRAINPAYTGPRPRIQLNHGNADETINFKNLGESIDEWSNVLGLDSTPTTTDEGFQGAAKTSTSGPVTYNRKFWKDECGFTVMEAWEALGQKHGMGYEAQAILEWFGLDEKRDQDPWDAACGGGNGPVGSDTGVGDATGTGTGGSWDAFTDADSVGANGSDVTSGAGGTGETDATGGTAGTGASQPSAPTTAPVTSTSAPAVTPSIDVTPDVIPSVAASAPATTSGPGPTSNVLPASSANSGGGCSMSSPASTSGLSISGASRSGTAMALLGLGLVLRRRRRH